MIWTDNMIIPKGAANKYTAELMMNFVYDPTIAAQIADYVYYVSPVKGADVAIKTLDAGRGDRTRCSSRRADVVAKQHNFQFLIDELEDVAQRRSTPTCPAPEPRPPRPDDRMTAARRRPTGPGCRGPRRPGRCRTSCSRPGMLWLAVFYVLPGDPDVHVLDLDRVARERVHDRPGRGDAYVDGPRPSSASSSSTRSSTAGSPRS